MKWLKTLRFIVLLALVTGILYQGNISEPHVVQGQTDSTTEYNLDYNILFSNLWNECESPCWKGIVLGESTELAWIQALRDLELDSEILIYEPSRTSPFKRILTSIIIDDKTIQPSEIRITGYIENELVVAIEFTWSSAAVTPDLMTKPITEFGIPSTIVLGIGRGTVEVELRAWVEFEQSNIYFTYETNVYYEPPYNFCLDTNTWERERWVPWVRAILHKLDKPIAEEGLRYPNFSVFSINEIQNLTDLTNSDFAELVLSDPSNRKVDCISFGTERLHSPENQ